jgi:hypothetical protein
MRLVAGEHVELAGSDLMRRVAQHHKLTARFAIS